MKLPRRGRWSFTAVLGGKKGFGTLAVPGQRSLSLPLYSTTLAENSWAEIAAAAGVSKGTLYYYYKNKTDILFDLTNAAMLGDEALRAKLIDRYAAFERLIAEKIAERTDVVSADYLSQLILLASDGMIVQEALRNDNFDAAAFVRQSEAYLRVLRPAGRD